MRRTADERGTTALEFGLVAPVILLMVFGILQYGYLFWSLETASATAREAARRLAVGTDWDCTREEVEAAAAIPAVGDSVQVPAPTYATDDGTPLGSAAVGALVTVVVRFDSLDLHLPFLPLPDEAVGRATARVENLPAPELACS
jgi:Flp pilus assembly protein TadG